MVDQGNGLGSKARPASRRVAQWMRDYVPLPGIPDEYIAEGGAPRAVWTRFFEAFATLTPGEIERRFGTADRHLREAGVSYRAPGETADRTWPLSHLPLLIDEAEWRQLSEGIVQRGVRGQLTSYRLPYRSGVPDVYGLHASICLNRYLRWPRPRENDCGRK